VKAKVFHSVLANLGLFPRDFVSCLPQNRKEKVHPLRAVGPANRRSSMYWRGMQLCQLTEKAFRSDARAVPKIVGEFLKACGN
jgi:hypothetical protein